jgi:hypothetical protein
MSNEPPKNKRQLLKYLWAVAVSGLVIAQVIVDKENKHQPLIDRALDLMQRQYLVDPIHDTLRTIPILDLLFPNAAPNSSMNREDKNRPN